MNLRNVGAFILSQILMISSSFALQNARLLRPAEEINLSGVVLISFDNYSTGTATYLGNGQFITAAHNLLGLEQKPEDATLTVSNSEKILADQIPRSDLKFFLPPSKITKQFVNSLGKSVLIPLPDVMVVQVAPKHLSKLKSLKPMRVQRYMPKVDEKLAVLGVGSTSYTGAEGDSLMRIGFLTVSEIENNSMVKSIWVQGAPGSAPRSGDSGGPLLRYDSISKQVVLVGITNSILLGNRNGRDASISRFQLINDKTVSSWLKSLGI